MNRIIGTVAALALAIAMSGGAVAQGPGEDCLDYTGPTHGDSPEGATGSDEYAEAQATGREAGTETPNPDQDATGSAVGSVSAAGGHRGGCPVIEPLTDEG